MNYHYAKFGDCSFNSLRENGSGVTYGSPAVCPSVRPPENLNIELYSETIRATVTKFGTKVLCDEALQNIYSTTTFTQSIKVKQLHISSVRRNSIYFHFYRSHSSSAKCQLPVSLIVVSCQCLQLVIDGVLYLLRFV